MNQPLLQPRFKLTENIVGDSIYRKKSYPVHCGSFSEIETENFVFHFNLNHEIIRVKNKGKNWGHPHEWLKRTVGNDWVYYSTGGYTGVFEATGEYYLPNFQYPTNSILGGHPFRLEEISCLTQNWYDLLRELQSKIGLTSQATDLTTEKELQIKAFLEKVLLNDPERLEEKASSLFNIIGDRISVLPPDARHVDYNLIPLTISKGCLYKCNFCKVKNRSPFSELKPANIKNQIMALKNLYKKNLVNYNSIFLGQHDALQASQETIIGTINQAIEAFNLTHSNINGNNTFLFGSVGSLLGANTDFFDELEKLPGNTYINIGLESADQETLNKIGKPIQAKDVKTAFKRIQEINDRFLSIEVTANFIMDQSLPPGHYPSINALIRDSLDRKKPKGSIYFSPLTFDQPSRARLFEFNRIKIMSRLPTFLYIIQRL